MKLPLKMVTSESWMNQEKITSILPATSSQLSYRRQRKKLCCQQPK